MSVLVVIGVGGMGEAIARREEPRRQVLLADYDEGALDRVAGSLRGAGYTVATQRVDVSDRASMRALADRAASLGPVERAAHTAGLSPVQAPADAVLRVDLAGVAYFLEEFGRVIARGGAGLVIASMAGSLSAGHFPAEVEAALTHTPADELLALPLLRSFSAGDAGAAYSLAKRANQLRVQAASLAWGARGARVNSISPGVIATPMGLQELSGDSGARMRAMIEASGSGRAGTAEEIAAAASFLLGDEAGFITGTDLLVDGGVVAAVRTAGSSTSRQSAGAGGQRDDNSAG